MEFLFDTTETIRKSYTIEAETYAEAKAALDNQSDDHYHVSKSIKTQAFCEVEHHYLGTIVFRAEKDEITVNVHDLKIYIDSEYSMVYKIELVDPVQCSYESGSDFFFEVIGHLNDVIKKVLPKYIPESMYYQIACSKVMDKLEYR
jgi:hypothetical protein